mgnify:CR=1 FL=1
MAATNFDSLAGDIKELKTLIADAKKPAGFVNKGAPHITTGAIGQDSQPFSISRFVKALKSNDLSLAKHEVGMMQRFQRAAERTNQNLSTAPGGLWLPTNLDGFGPELTSNSESEADVNYCKAVLGATQPNLDPDEQIAMARKGMFFKAQSAFIDTTGGSLVAPPTQGEVIPLIRPNAAVLAAGASTMTLPPNGRHVRPRITGAPTVQALAEGSSTPTSNLTTDQLELSARKIGGACVLSEESSNFTSGALDRYCQEQLNMSLGLKFDAYALYGSGGTLYPAGVTSSTYSGTGQVINFATAYTNARGLGTNGNSLLPEYGELIPALIKERSFGLDSKDGKWIMRPMALAMARAARASAITAGDKQGQKVDLNRTFADKGAEVWSGYNVVESTNLRNDRTKGSATDLSDAFFGIWKHLIVATYGAIQFQTGHDGNTFLNGQYIVRATMYGDVGLEYPGAFLWYKDILGPSSAQL